jgi:hypothetical protein
LARRTHQNGESSRGPDPLLWIALAGALVFLIVGIGLPLLGVRSFAGVDLLNRYEPYRSATPTGFQPTNTCVSDTVDAVFPRANEFRERLHDGDWPARSSLMSGGAALGSTPGGAYVSPLSLPYYVMPTWLAPGYVKVLEIAACVLGMFLFLRRLGLRRSSSVLGGVLFASSGFMVVWSNWSQSRTAAFIPALFWAIERFTQERRWTAAAPIAVIVAFLVFGGFPAVTGYALYAAGAYALLRCGLSRARPWPAVAWLGGATVAVATGFALTAWQLLPFATRLGGYELVRGQSGASHLPPITLATTAFPTALGSCGGGVSYFGPLNDIETNTFIGAAALVLVVVALVRRPPAGTPRGVRGFFVGAALVAVILGWFGGPLLALAQEFPVFSNNPVGRIRSVLGFFLAVLAAMGFDSLLRRPERPRRPAQLFEVGVWVAGAAGFLFMLYRVQLASRGHAEVSSTRYIVPIAAAVVAAAVVWVASMQRFSTRHVLRTTALAAIPVLVVVESLVWVLPFWPRVPVDDFYPETPVHEFLADNLDGERFESAGGTMLTGTNAFYGLSTPTGHAFTDPRWKDMLRAIEPNVFRTQTYSAFSGRMPIERATSPIFDRMGVKYLVLTPGDANYGRRETVGSDGAGVSIPAGGAAEVAIGEGPLRGVSVELREPLAPSDPFARISVEVVDAQGRVVAHSLRRTYAQARSGEFLVPVAGEDLPVDEPLRARVRLDSRDGELRLVGSDGAPRVTVTRPEPDGLRLVFADGAAVYERLRAQPRIRWASTSQVVTDERAQLEMLTRVPAGDTVLVETPVPAGDGRPADVDVTADEGDHIEARVNAQGSGYLVVADARTRGLRASVDGRRSDVVRVDHALVAVPVPAGEHVVEIDYIAPRSQVGALVSLAAACALVLVGVIALRRRRATVTTPD